MHCKCWFNEFISKGLNNLTISLPHIFLLFDFNKLLEISLQKFISILSKLIFIKFIYLPMWPIYLCLLTAHWQILHEFSGLIYTTGWTRINRNVKLNSILWFLMAQPYIYILHSNGNFFNTSYTFKLSLCLVH